MANDPPASPPDLEDSEDDAEGSCSPEQLEQAVQLLDAELQRRLREEPIMDDDIRCGTLSWIEAFVNKVVTWDHFGEDINAVVEALENHQQEQSRHLLSFQNDGDWNS